MQSANSAKSAIQQPKVPGILQPKEAVSATTFCHFRHQIDVVTCCHAMYGCRFLRMLFDAICTEAMSGKGRHRKPHCILFWG